MNVPSTPGMTWIAISSFFKKYVSVLSPQLMRDINDATIKGVKKAQISKATIAELDARLAEKKAEDKRIRDCAKRNDRGRSLEKSGKIPQAIKVYEENIGEGCYPASYSFDRLMVLYRKAKDFDNEARIIERAIDVLGLRYPDLRSKYQERLMKVRTLQGKRDK